jgi:hypothetical protein
MGPIRRPETSVHNYHTTPHNIPEEGRSHQHRSGSLKLRFLNEVPILQFYKIQFALSNQLYVRKGLKVKTVKD